MTELIFDGKSTQDFGVWISGTGTWGSPERDVTHISIPGRDGDLTIDNKRFQNISVVYPAFIAKGFRDRFDDFRAYMVSRPGYHRLEDSYHPDEYRMAEFYQALEPEVGTLNRFGSFDLEFYCKPQRWLKSGEKVTAETTFASSGQVFNPTLFSSKPLLRVYGTGSVKIGSETLTIINADVYTDIDCDLMDAFKGSTNCNGNIRLSSGSFPVLKPGYTGITLNGVTKVEITPKWFTI